MAQKLTHYLLLTLILSLGFGQLLRFVYFNHNFYLHDLLIIMIFIINLKFVITKVIPGFIRHQPLRFFTLALIISSFYALTQYPFLTLLTPILYLLRLLSYISLYLFINESKISLNQKYFFIASLVSLILGLAQYILLPDMRLFQYLGWDDHLSRLTLPHFDPTFSAVMLSLAIFSFPKYSPFYFLGILLSYARSVWISLLFAFIFSLKNRLILLLLICTLILGVILLPRSFGEGTNLLRTYSITSRYQSDLSYIQKYNWQLLVGRGMNTLILDQTESVYDNHATGPNNSYLYLLATTGVLGLVGWGKLMISLYQKSSHKPMLLFFFISSLFNNVMLYPFALLWIFLLSTNKVNQIH